MNTYETSETKQENNSKYGPLIPEPLLHSEKKISAFRDSLHNKTIVQAPRIGSINTINRKQKEDRSMDENGKDKNDFMSDDYIGITHVVNSAVKVSEDHLSERISTLSADIHASEERTTHCINGIETRMDDRLNRIEDMIGNIKTENKNTYYWVAGLCSATFLAVAAIAISAIVSQ